MSKYKKEPYSLEQAKACGIHSSENAVVVRWNNSPKWIYRVEVANFDFAFFSIDMLDEYIGYFASKTLPQQSGNQFTSGPAASIGDGQTPFERLPARLSKKNIRPRVLKALNEARCYFTRLKSEPR